MKYNLGDKVCIKSIDWYNKNKNKLGDITLGNNYFTDFMSKYCGQTATIVSKDRYYHLDIDKGEWAWSDFMLENNINNMETKKVKITLPKGYKAKDLNTKVINDTIIVEYIPEKKYVPNDGDIIYVRLECCEFLSIFKKEDKIEIYSYCDLDLINSNDLYTKSPYHSLCDKDGIKELRPANEIEKKYLFDILEEQGLRWNATEKKIENFRWRAERGEHYYCIVTTGADCYPIKMIDDKSDSDCKHYYLGNYFQTEKEAQKYVEKVKDLFKNR